MERTGVPTSESCGNGDGECELPGHGNHARLTGIRQWSV